MSVHKTRQTREISRQECHEQSLGKHFLIRIHHSVFSANVVLSFRSLSLELSNRLAKSSLSTLA
jgi:hypothetical protein